MDEELLTLNEVAKFLKVNPLYVVRITKKGELPVIKRGSRFTRYRKSDLIAFLDRYTQREGGTD